MTHSVIGFIVRNDFVHQICSKYPSLCAVPLEQGFSLFPLTEDLVKSLGIPHSITLMDSDKSPNELTNVLSKLSALCPLLYFETEYFGGIGHQIAIIFKNGMITFGPAKNEIGPINEGLRLLGARRKASADEFDSIGLGRYRYTTDWLK